MDIGGSRAATAVVVVTPDLRVAAVEVYNGDESVLQATEAVRRLARDYAVVGVCSSRGVSRAKRCGSSATASAQ